MEILIELFGIYVILKIKYFIGFDSFDVFLVYLDLLNKFVKIF